MSINIITISREFGSGGRAIGEMLAKKLGIPCYDSQIIEKVAEKSGFDKDYVHQKGEYIRKTPLSGVFKSNVYYKSSNEDIIFEIQSKTVRDFASEGPCVIVGRCADYVLKDRDDVFNVMIYSDMKSRIERIINVYGEKAEGAEKLIKYKDKCRSSYYQFYTDMKWGEARNYDICLNSAALGFDQCVDIMYDICKK